jgi:hypothetical protein
MKKAKFVIFLFLVFTFISSSVFAQSTIAKYTIEALAKKVASQTGISYATLELSALRALKNSKISLTRSDAALLKKANSLNDLDSLSSEAISDLEIVLLSLPEFSTLSASYSAEDPYNAVKTYIPISQKLSTFAANLKKLVDKGKLKRATADEIIAGTNASVSALGEPVTGENALSACTGYSNEATSNLGYILNIAGKALAKTPKEYFKALVAATNKLFPGKGKERVCNLANPEKCKVLSSKIWTYCQVN